jgi:adenosylcobyric acid synthase
VIGGLFDEGVKFLGARTGVPVLGVIPFLRDLALDQEDSLDTVCRSQVDFVPDRINIAVTLLPRMSHFTDFNALAAEEDVALRYVSSPSELVAAEVIVIPGSKNTLADLAYLRLKGLAAACDDHVSGKKELIGICGGYQMLGRRITDPYQMEEGGTVDGLGPLNVETELQQDKRTIQVEAHSIRRTGLDETALRGYQIRLGMTKNLNERYCFIVRTSSGEEELDGAVSSDGLVWGTYIHGYSINRAFVDNG